MPCWRLQNERHNASTEINGRREKMAKITIDGKTIEVENGTTVLNAARQLEVDIPTLCDHPELTPYGGCRLCLVEVEGARTLQPSCTLPVSDGMVVNTDTEKIHEARKFVLSMLFSERNHFCPYCQVSGGDCELQNSAYAEDMTHWPIQPNWHPYPVDASHPFIILDHNRCILCRRCVRACGELVGNFTLGFEERGADSTLVADLGLPLGESSCIGCGTCVQVCPTGTLIDRWSAYQGKETDVETTKTICLGCSVGCGIDVLTRDNRLVRIEGDWSATINHGLLCDVGRFLPMVEERERILTPMVKTDGKLKAATWDDALKVAAEMISKNKGNLDGVTSTRVSLEAMAQLRNLCEAYDAQSLLTTEDCQAVSAIYHHASSDETVLEGKVEDLLDADCYLTFGEDITKDHQVLSFFAKRRIPEGAQIIQITNKDSGLDNFATITLKVPEKSLADFLNDLKNLLSGKSAELTKIAENHSLGEDELRSTVDALQSSDKSVILFGSRFDYSNSDAVVIATKSLSQAANAKLITTKGNINSVGAAALGFEGAGNTKSDLLLMLLADEELTQCIEQKFEKTPQRIVFSSYVSSLTAGADVVFPVKNWLEQDGHIINFDGHILEQHAALEAAPEVYSNNDAIEKLASILNVKNNIDWEKELEKFTSPVKIAV
jgi:formate dehydrogenase major subunit